MNLSQLSISISSSLIFIQLLGVLMVSWGGVRLIQGLRGQGQSAEGVALLRAELVRLTLPLALGGGAVMALLGLALWERSALTEWVQLIAPLSTLLWVGWSYRGARRVKSGELFEALVPLAPHARPELAARASAWVSASPALNTRGLMQTAFQALEDAQGSGSRRSLSAEVTLEIMQESLRELHQASLRFPLAQQLTLSDWIYEGERLSRHWQGGLSWITRGRALLNPFTLLDYKGLWRWTEGSPAELFQRELAAWLHQGLYILVTQRVEEQLLSSQEGQPAQPQARSEELSTLSDEASALWNLMTFKFTGPLWLYLGLSGLAAIEGHGWIGVALSLAAAGLLWGSVRRASALPVWREAFERLAEHKRDPLPSEGPVTDEVSGMIGRLSERFADELSARKEPCQGLLSFTQQSWEGLSYAYRRELPDLSEPNPILLRLNVTLPDTIATLYWLCDDLKHFSESTAGSLLKGLSSYLGDRFEGGGFEATLISAAQSWSLEGESEQISAHEQEGAGDELMESALTQATQRGDLWLKEKVYEANFLVSAVATPLLNNAVESVQRWVASELSTRLNAMYRGEVPTLPLQGSVSAEA